MNKSNFMLTIILLSFFAVPAAQAVTEPDDVKLHESDKFTLGIGAAIVRFDSKIKFTDKQNGDQIFLDPEGNLDLPEISHVTTFYGAYSITPKHGIGFSFFRVNRESVLIDFDETVGDVTVLGKATIADNTHFYRLSYAYTLFDDAHNKIKLDAGIYGLDLKYVFTAEGQITIREFTRSGSIVEEANVFAPLPMIGLNFLTVFTPRWSLSTRVSLVAGEYEDVRAGVLQTTINTRYKFTDHVGLMFGIAYFDATVNIEDEVEKTEISYGYSGGYIGMHFMF
jgi:hypothetical protein